MTSLNLRAVGAFCSCIVLLLLGSHALGASDTVRWANATTMVGGQPLPLTGPEALATTRIQVGTCSGTAFATVLQEASVAPTVTSHTFSGLIGGATVCYRGFHRNVAGQDSLASNIRQAVVATSPPGPPVLSTTATVALSIKGNGKNADARLVGFIPLGTPCGARSRSVGGTVYYEVPESSIDFVSWRGGKKFWGICGASA